MARNNGSNAQRPQTTTIIRQPRFRAPRRGDDVTGGTGDFSPQLLTAYISESASDTATTTAVPLPVTVNGPGKPRIVEILKIYFTPSRITEADSDMQIAVSTTSFGSTAVTSDPRVIGAYRIWSELTTSGYFVQNYPFVIDLTDGGGHGVLVATPNLYLQVSSAAQSVSVTCVVKILYRIKAVALPEYVGIVQSQS